MKEESRKERVVCISEKWFQVSGYEGGNARPLKGEIYEVIDSHQWQGKSYYKLKEFPSDCWWNVVEFRPIDSNFGEAVCSFP